jgi:cell division septal protein FtsQ
LKRRQVKRSYEFKIPERKSSREESGIIKKPKKINWAKISIKYSPYILAFIVLFYIVFISNVFRVGKVDVQGPNTELTASLTGEVDKYLSSGLTGRNWLFLNASDLKNRLQKTFSGQESIIIQKSFPNRLTVKTDEQKSGIVWKTGGGRYIVSLNGRVIGEVKDQNINGLAVVNDGSNIPVSIGDKIISRDFVDFTIKLNSYLKANNLGPEQISIAETTSEMTVKTNSGYDIRLNTSENIDTQLRALTGTLDSLKSQNKKPTQYIDLRVSGRAFYK